MDMDKDILALADVYAEALFHAAAAQQREAEIAEQFNSLLDYMRKDQSFANFMISKVLDPDDRRESLERLFRGRMDDLLLNLLQVLNRRRRSELVFAIGRCVQLRMETQRDQEEVTVQSAVPLPEDIRTSIRSTVQRWIGKTPILIEEVEPELIGGLVLKLGDIRVDASIDFQLKQLHRKLHERVTLEVHQGVRYLTDADE